MIDDVPPLVAAAQVEAPSPVLPPAGESNLPAPTVEQALRRRSRLHRLDAASSPFNLAGRMYEHRAAA